MHYIDMFIEIVQKTIRSNFKYTLKIKCSLNTKYQILVYKINFVLYKNDILYNYDL